MSFRFCVCLCTTPPSCSVLLYSARGPEIRLFFRNKEFEVVRLIYPDNLCSVCFSLRARAAATRRWRSKFILKQVKGVSPSSWFFSDRFGSHGKEVSGRRTKINCKDKKCVHLRARVMRYKSWRYVARPNKRAGF